MKLGGNAFRTILHISFFDVENFFGGVGGEADPDPDRWPGKDRCQFIYLGVY